MLPGAEDGNHAASMVAVGSVLVAFAPSFGIPAAGRRTLQTPLGVFLPLELAIARSRSEDTAGRSITKLVEALTVGGAVGATVAGILLAMIENLTIVLLVPAVSKFLRIPVAAWLVRETTTRSAGTVDRFAPKWQLISSRAPAS